MMCIIFAVRQSRDGKAKSHQRIVEVASARIRERGTDAPAVAEIMEAAGLTHGGFYKHFRSRDELIAEAVDRTFADGERAFSTITDGVEDPLAAFVGWYTSAAHRDNAAAGCGLVALGTDVPRCEEGIRESYTAQVRRYLSHLESLIGSDPDAHRRATVALSALVGAVLIARAIDDEGLSDEILRTVANAVKSLPIVPE
jgi:TetR/AcrR family transcriptional repressor of nem operon